MSKEKTQEQENINNVSNETNIDFLKEIEIKKQEMEKASEEIDKKLKELEEKNKLVEGKVNQIEIKLNEIPEKELKAESLSTGETLKKEKQVTLMIPKSELNPKEKIVPVTINGFTYIIKRGEKVTVPETVENILTEAGYL